MKLTPWFDSDKVLPVRAGYYLVRTKGLTDPTELRFFYFDPDATTTQGDRPLWWFSHRAPARGVNYNCTDYSRHEWRGITKPAEAM